MKTIAMIGLVSFLLSGCSLVPAVAQKAGLGIASDEQIVEATAKQFGVAPSTVTITDVKKDSGFSGTRIFYAAQVNGKNFRCYLGSSIMGDSLPTCAKPGEPLNVPG